MFRNAVPLFLAAGVLSGAPALADWTSVHRDNSNNAVVPIPSVVTDVSGGPAASSAALDLATSARPVLADGRAYVVQMDDGGTPFDPSDDALRLVALSPVSLAVEWTSVDLDVGDSVSFGSTAAPTFVDFGTVSLLFYGSGSTVHAVDAASGNLEWTTTLDDSNTAPTDAAYALINSSAVYGDGKVFVSTYYDAFGAASDLSQVVALDAATGDVEWFVVTGGRGQAGPVYFDEGLAQPIVIVNTDAGLVALSTDDGSAVWSHDDAGLPGGPWTVDDDFWVEPIVADGSLFAATYNFGGTGGNLVRVNPATGELLWKNDLSATLVSDCPLIYVGSPARLYALGGPFGDASLSIYDPADGNELDRVELNVGVFRNYMAATEEHLYLAADGVRVLDLDGDEESLYSVGGINAPVSVASDGSVYLVAGGQLHRFEQTTSVRDWSMFD